ASRPSGGLFPEGAIIKGTAILMHQGLDLGIVKIDFEINTPSGRVAAVALEVPGHAPLLLYSGYLEDKVGLNETNLALLARVAQLAQEHRLPPG
ncbi:unnamed protein product, partial [Prorocentrum cordatum]